MGVVRVMGLRGGGDGVEMRVVGVVGRRVSRQARDDATARH